MSDQSRSVLLEKDKGTKELDDYDYDSDLDDYDYNDDPNKNIVSKICTPPIKMALQLVCPLPPLLTRLERKQRLKSQALVPKLCTMDSNR